MNKTIKICSLLVICSCTLSFQCTWEIIASDSKTYGNEMFLLAMEVCKDGDNYHKNVTCSVYAQTRKTVFLTWFQNYDNINYFSRHQECYINCTISFRGTDPLKVIDDKTKVYCTVSLNETNMNSKDLKSTYETLYVRHGENEAHGNEDAKSSSSLNNELPIISKTQMPVAFTKKPSIFNSHSSSQAFSPSTELSSTSTPLFSSNQAFSLSDQTFPTQAASSDTNSKDQYISTELVASLSVLAVLLLILLVYLIYYFKFRERTKTTQPANNQEATHVIPEITYAELSLPEPVKQPFKRESVVYSEIVASKSPENDYVNLSSLKPAAQPHNTEMAIYSEVIMKK